MTPNVLLWILYISISVTSFLCYKNFRENYATLQQTRLLFFFLNRVNGSITILRCCVEREMTCPMDITSGPHGQLDMVPFLYIIKRWKDSKQDFCTFVKKFVKAISIYCLVLPLQTWYFCNHHQSFISLTQTLSEMSSICISNEVVCLLSPACFFSGDTNSTSPQISCHCHLLSQLDI